MAHQKTYFPYHHCLWSVFCQVVGNIAGVIAVHAWTSVFFVIVIQTGVAVSLAWWRALPRQWLIFNALFPLVTAFIFYFHIPPLWLGAISLLLVLLNLPTLWTGVPFYPTSTAMYQAILATLPADKPFRFIDLGCGYASLLSFLAQARPQGEFVGVEISALPLFVAKLRALFIPNMKIVAQSLWQTPCGSYDYIYAFLAPGPMEALWEKLRNEIHRDARFLVNTFALEKIAEKQIAIDDYRRTVLYFYGVTDPA